MRKYFFVIFILFSINVCAQDKINEDELFSSPETVIKNTNIVSNAPEKKDEDKKSFGVSGELTTVLSFTGSRDWFEKGKDDNNRLDAYTLGNLFLDARLQKGTKGFANVEAQYNSGDNKTNFLLKEMFLDFNIKNNAYIRTGKQVLQWGRCYLWNPTDLVNIEKKTFLKKIGSREGVYGIKLSVPFGSNLNIYSFINTSGAANIDTTAIAGKVEFILGKTEMAFSTWNKKGYKSVYAYDFSTRIFEIDTIGEAAFSYGDNYERIEENQGILSGEKIKDKWIPRASIGFGKSFDYKDVSDKFSFNMEFYYNHTGYTKNILNDTTTYAFSHPIELTSQTGGSPTIKTSGTKKEFLFYDNLYEPNSFSRYYMAIFTNVNKFIISDMQLNLNLIRNLNDDSNILTTGINYKDLSDFSIGFNVYSYIGKKDREYTFFENALTTQLTLGIIF